MYRCTMRKQSVLMSGPAATGPGGAGDDTRVSQRAKVHPKFGVIVAAQELQVHLGDAILVPRPGIK